MTLLKDDNLITDSQANAEVLREHFAKISSNDNTDEPFKSFKTIMEHGEYGFQADLKQQRDKESSDGINSPINFYELEAAINKANGTSAPGNDHITYSMLKQLPKNSKMVLLSLYNLAWAQKLLPQQWKEAIILLFPKVNKDPTDPNSYRPIALTSCIGKNYRKNYSQPSKLVLGRKPYIKSRTVGLQGGSQY